MCEQCDEIRREGWSNIRDILNYKRPRAAQGPIATQIAERIEEAKNLPEFQEQLEDPDYVERVVDCIRTQMIAEMCAIIARKCEGTRHHDQPASIVMLEWAQQLRQQEMMQMLPPGLADFINAISGGDVSIMGPFIIPLDGDDNSN